MAKFDPSQNQNVLDASLGLIYRLNLLWQKADIPAANGNYDRWNFILDRIFCNLMYKNDFNVTHDSKGKVIDVELNEEDEEVYQHLNKKVTEAIMQKNLVRSFKERHVADRKLYEALMLKDIGLRKFMFKLKLYLKQTDSNPSRAMWGG